MQNPPATGNKNATDQPVLLFDGHCHLCSGAVQFILKHESEPVLLFAPLQSAYALRLLSKLTVPEAPGNSLVLVENDRVFERSDAAIRICNYLTYPWKILATLKIIPRAIRNLVYDFIARKRYRWFGRSEQCWVPHPTLKSRFRDI